jgi:hypothetical protein
VCSFLAVYTAVRIMGYFLTVVKILTLVSCTHLHPSRSHRYRQPLSTGRFQVESHRASPVQSNQQKLGWRTPHRHRQDPQVHPYHQNGIRPHRQCLSHPRELRYRNQDLRRGNASTQPRSPRNARPLELYRTPHSECELVLGHRLTSGSGCWRPERASAT